MQAEAPEIFVLDAIAAAQSDQTASSNEKGESPYTDQFNPLIVLRIYVPWCWA